MKNKVIECPPLYATATDGTQMQVVNYPALLALDADVYLIFGMRSFGKSYGIKKYALERWFEHGENFVMMRTLEDDITQGKAKRYIADMIPFFNEMVDYEQELVVYSSDFIARSIGDGNQIIRDKVGSVMSLSGWLKYKGNSYEKTTTIIFEEFLERKAYLSDDVFLEGYLNNLSTVIRLRQNVKVFCLANTVRKKSPLFNYYHIDLHMIKKGVPSLFTESNGLRVCVYWTPDVEIDQKSSKHYTVDESKQAKMITSGAWEESDYPTSWEGLPVDKVQEIRRYRNAPKIYLPDHDITVFAIFTDAPLLFIKGRCQYKQMFNIALSDMYYSLPTLFGAIRKKVLCDDVVHDGKCADVIDYIKDKII